jgi:predicted small lipoprotein YifL
MQMKRQSTKTVLLVLIAAATIVSLSACGSKEQPLQSSGSSNNQNQSVSETNDGNSGAAANGGNSNGNAGSTVNAGGTGDAGSGGNDQAADPAPPEKKKEDISVFYTDDQMIDLHAQKTTIEYADEKEKLTAAFDALKKDSDKGEASLWKKIELLSAKQDGDAVTLDVHIPDDARLGAPGEQLALGALTQTYFQFKDIASLNVLVDGEAVESLMGHEDLEHPIKKQ